MDQSNAEVKDAVAPNKEVTLEEQGDNSYTSLKIEKKLVPKATTLSISDKIAGVAALIAVLSAAFSFFSWRTSEKAIDISLNQEGAIIAIDPVTDGAIEENSNGVMRYPIDVSNVGHKTITKMETAVTTANVKNLCHYPIQKSSEPVTLAPAQNRKILFAIFPASELKNIQNEALEQTDTITLALKVDIKYWWQNSLQKNVINTRTEYFSVHSNKNGELGIYGLGDSNINYLNSKNAFNKDCK